MKKKKYFPKMVALGLAVILGTLQPVSIFAKNVEINWNSDASNESETYEVVETAALVEDVFTDTYVDVSDVLESEDEPNEVVEFVEEDLMFSSEAVETVEFVEESAELFTAGETDEVVLEDEEVVDISNSPNKIDANTTLSEDVVYTGDVVLSNDLNLNGYHMTVNGNLYQIGGSLTVGAGTLEVTGDYRMQSQKTDENGDLVWGSASAYLYMNNSENGLVQVYGTFVNQSTSSSSWTKGTMEFYGDVYQKNVEGEENTDNFSSDYDHKIVLKGVRKRFVSESQKLYLNNLETSEDADVTVSGPVEIRSLSSDVSLKSNNMQLMGLNLGTNQLTIKGSVYMIKGIYTGYNREVNLDTGKLIVDVM